MDESLDKVPLGRREQRKLERRAAIVDVATRIFLERGYAGTSLTAIVDEMGGSKGTLWSYFSSKQELFAAVVDAAADSFLAVASPMLGAGNDVERSLTRFFEAFIERITSPASIAMQRLIIGESARASEVGPIFYDRAPARTHAMISEFLAQRMAEGDIRSDDPEEASEFLFRLCAGGLQERILWGMEGPGGDSIRKEARFVVRHFLAAYAKI